MILAGPTPAATPVANVLTRAHVVHAALRAVLADLDYGLSAVSLYADDQRVVVVAPSPIAAARWQLTYPADEIRVGDHPVPLHIAVEGDVEGGRS